MSFTTCHYYYGLIFLLGGRGVIYDWIMLDDPAVKISCKKKPKTCLHLDSIESSCIHFSESVFPILMWNPRIMDAPRYISEWVAIFKKCVVVIINCKWFICWRAGYLKNQVINQINKGRDETHSHLESWMYPGMACRLNLADNRLPISDQSRLPITDILSGLSL